MRVRTDELNPGARVSLLQEQIEIDAGISLEVAEPVKIGALLDAQTLHLRRRRECRPSL